MIAFARADARRFRAVARRCAPNGRPRGPAPPVRIAATGENVTLTAHLGEVVVALQASAAGPSTGSVILSLAALEAFEGAGTGAVTLEAGGRRGALISAQSQDADSARTAELDSVESDANWPEEPASFAPVPTPFLAALHESGRSAARDSSRYALTCVQLKGEAGQVVGTDGKQALVWGGFEFQFADDVLVPAVPVFGSKDFAAQSTVGVGIVGDWLCVAAGPWRVWLRIDREGRFPDVLGAVPRANGTRLTVADTDVPTLLAALARLPGADQESQPVTLDLGPSFVVRGRDEASGTITEVSLSDSVTVGPPVRLALCRDHLGRAVSLVFRDFRIASPERPIVAHDGDRLYLAAVLNPSDAVAPDPTPISPRPLRRTNVPRRETPPPEHNGHAEPDLLDPLIEAEAMRAALVEATGRAARLVASLKQFKRERRALATAWSSLKQLNLGP